MKKKLLHIALLGGILTPAFAQDQAALMLPSVTVLEKRDAFWMPGRTEFRLDSTYVQSLGAESLTESLKQLSVVHLREYTPGSAASFSIRGASSAQNAIVWNGYNINSPGTGMTDLSLLQSGFFSITHSAGGSAPQFGSGAMGSVLLLYQPLPKDSFELLLIQSMGSFGTQRTLLSLSQKRKHFSFSTRLFQGSTRNDYSYENPISGQKDERFHAGNQQSAFSQMVGYSFNEHHALEVESFFTYAFRQSPNNVLVQNPSAASLNDRLWRNRIDYHFQKGNNTLNLGYAYLHEWQEYQDPNLTDENNVQLRDTNTSASQIFKADYEYVFSGQWAVTAAWQMRSDEVSGSNRNGRQSTHAISTGLRYSRRNWVSALYVRSELWDGSLQPAIPQFSAEWKIRKTWRLSSRIGSHYRLPTLNDRFWNPGGNLDLLPESGYNVELGLSKEVNWKGEQRTSIGTKAYQGLTDNYIIWIPGTNGMSSPQNLRTVETHGLELEITHLINFRKSNLTIRWETANTNARILESYLEGDKCVGKQLIYQPRWKHSAFLVWTLGKWTLSLDNQYTGVVSADYSSGTLPAFNLLGTSFTRSFNSNFGRWNLSFDCRNVLDERYATISYFSMPGRNFLLTFDFRL